MLSTSLEAVYEFTMSPSSVHGTEGVCFRFMPDSRQVEKALEVRPSRYMMPTGMIARVDTWVETSYREALIFVL